MSFNDKCIEAIENDDINTLIKLMLNTDKIFDTNQIFNHDMTPLTQAIKNGNMEMVYFLLKLSYPYKPSSTHVKNFMGPDALTTSFYCNNFEMIKFFFEYELNKNKSYVINVNNLYLFLSKCIDGIIDKKYKKDRFDIESIKKLEKDGIEIMEYLFNHQEVKNSGINITDILNPKPFSLLFYPIKNNLKEVTIYLIEKGCNVNFLDDMNRDFLTTCSNTINSELANLLIDKGININNKGKDGSTPLIWSMKTMNYDLIKTLINRGCDLNIVDNYQRTALMEACYYTNLDIVKFLIEKGADFMFKSSYGEDAFCRSYNKKNIFLYLYKNNMYNKELLPDFLFICIGYRKYYTIPYLLNKIDNLNNIIYDNMNILEYILNFSKIEEIVEILQYLTYSDVIFQVSNFKYLNHYGNDVINIYKEMMFKKSKDRSDFLREELIAKYMSPENIEKWGLAYNKPFDEVIEIM